MIVPLQKRLKKRAMLLQEIPACCREGNSLFEDSI